MSVRRLAKEQPESFAFNKKRVIRQLSPCDSEYAFLWYNEFITFDVLARQFGCNIFVGNKKIIPVV